MEQNNVCNKGENCDFRHDMDGEEHSKQVQICKYFLSSGMCKSKDKCPYKHIRYICKEYEAGFCPLGQSCVNIHEETKACPNYLLGFCPKGPDCPLVQ